MDCKICGKPLPEGGTVCKYCGAKQRVVETDTKPAAERRYSKKGLARRRMINTILIGVIALLSVAIVAGIVVSVRPTGGTDAQDAQHSDSQTPTLENTPDNPDSQQDLPVQPDDADDQTDDTSKPDDADDQTDDTSKPDESDDQKDDTSKADDADDQTDDTSKADDADDQTDDTSKADNADDQKDDASKADDADDKTDDTSKADNADDQKDDASSQPSQTPVIKTGDYTATINRTAVDASLNHYRSLKLSIDQTLPEGVEVSEIRFTSSDPAVVRTEVVDGEGRAWGMALGKATVTGTVVLNTGETASASCEVTVVEYKEPPAEEKPASSGSTGTGSSSGSSGGNTGSTSSADYILPGSDSKVYSKSDLKHLSGRQLRLARNEIYARHGRIFSDPELQAYFESKSWYHGTIQPQDFKDSMLNSVEKKNIETIQKLEG